MVVAYLMYRFGWTLQDAFGLVSKNRPITGPNPGFLRELVRYEKELFRHNTMKLDEWLLVPVDNTAPVPRPFQFLIF